jgi:ornithine carbamoyltransferase
MSLKEGIPSVRFPHNRRPTVMKFTDIDDAHLGYLLETAGLFHENGVDAVSKQVLPTEVIGSLFQSGDFWEPQIAGTTAGWLDCTHVPLRYSDPLRMSDDEILEYVAMMSNSVDLLLTSFVDMETFGGGRRLTERFPEVVSSPMVSLQDDIYAHQSALACISALQPHLDGLRGREIGITWSFGTRLGLPNSVHSLLRLLLKLGVDIRLTAPPEFAPLNRVLRTARKEAEQRGLAVKESEDLRDGLDGVDGVVVLNWGPLKNFNDIEGNTEIAQQYRDWVITGDLLRPRVPFIMEPPTKRGLGVSEDLYASGGNLTHEWFTRRIAVLSSTIIRMVNLPDAGSRVV